MITRECADADEEAAWICDRIESMVGLAFKDTADAEARGVSYSDLRCCTGWPFSAGPAAPDSSLDERAPEDYP